MRFPNKTGEGRVNAFLPATRFLSLRVRLLNGKSMSSIKETPTLRRSVEIFSGMVLMQAGFYEILGDKSSPGQTRRRLFESEIGGQE